MQKLFEMPAYQRLPLDLVSARGDQFALRDGREVLDLYGGHCVNSLGAGDAGLGQALAAQWEQLSFATNLMPLEVRARFLAALEPLMPDGTWYSFLSNSGAEANENALKAAFAATGRSFVVAFEGAFHGRTAAATWVSDVQKRGFPKAPFDVRRVPFGDLEHSERAIKDDVAAVILEPIQSLAGVIEPPAGFLELLRKRCDISGALLIFDDVQTGNGRLGTPWSAQHYKILPDMFTTAKGVGGGFPLGLTLFSEHVQKRVDAKLFGSTFGGGPLALLAAAYVAEAIGKPGFLENVRAASAAFAKEALVGPVKKVRGAGLLLGLEIDPTLKASAVRDGLLAQGVFVGTSNLSHVLRLSPSLTIQPAAAQTLRRALLSLEVLA